MFDGNPLNYWCFVSHFDAYTSRGVMDMADKLNLIFSCTEKVKESIADYILVRSSELGYYEARIFAINFHQKHAVVSANERKLTGVYLFAIIIDLL